MAMQLVVDKLAKAFGIQEVFKDVSFMVAKGEKIGLVGVNGSGKSTLVKCLLQPEYADRGTISFEPGIQIGYVEQGFGSIGDESVWDFMLKANPEILALRKKLKDLETASASGSQDVLDSYARVTQRYEYLDGYNYEAKLKMVLFGLAFPESMWQMNASTLSGGQKTRLMLAAALVSSPDFMLLDEPTNHLDIRMMEWLEGYLRDFRGGVLVVSHDRAFLDHVTTRILEMEGGRLRSFTGNYTKYLAQKDILMRTEKAAYEAQQNYIAEQEAYIRRFKAGIKSKMARGRQSQLDRLERLEAPVENETFSLRLPKAPESAERVLILEHLKAGYGNNVLVQNIDLVLRRREKVGLIGPNGSGKTTLLRTILGEIPALGGEAKIGNRVKIGYFSQSYERLDPKQTLLDNFLTEYGLTDEQTRSLLGGMLFHGDDVFKEIGTLSGGQKARLVLLKLVLDGANLLILDEPTNHLDILAKETVEAALELFDGTVLVVSHDRYLVNEVTNRIWEIEDGQILDYKGNYEFYLEEKAKRKQTEDLKAKARPEAVEVRKGSVGRQSGSEEFDKTDARPLSGTADGSATVIRDAGKPWDGKVKIQEEKRKPARKKHSPAQLEDLIAKVELRIREQEAMLGYLDKQISTPENQMDLEKSRAMAAEREEYVTTIDKLVQQWEELLEEQELQEE
ncbi:MAG: ATP-binding cassette domain-containing protein [Acidaminococcaceae bacterium]|nr:ATP-binding cassette domain-containing protein [Acidaminococcaceae bacterium]